MNFFKKLFGGKKTNTEAALEGVLQNLIDKSKLDLSFDIKVSPDEKEVVFDLYGEDENIATSKEGALLNAYQLFLRRYLQSQHPGEKIRVTVDCDGFRDSVDDELIALADKLKTICLKKKKTVYFRAFPPRERKIIHQHLSKDKKVKSKSVGEGLYKKIKVFPAQGPDRSSNKKQPQKEQQHKNKEVSAS